MKCPYCESVFDFETLKERDEVLNQPEADMEWGNKAGQGKKNTGAAAAVPFLLVDQSTV